MSQNESKTLRASWEDLTPQARRRVIIQTVVHVLLVVLAFRSLSKRSEAGLRGAKPLWKVVIPASMIGLKGGNAWVVPLGPILYFVAGRRWRWVIDATDIAAEQ